MWRKFLGIDIGTCYIKLVEITLGKRSIVLSNPTLINTPGFLVQGGRIRDNSELTFILKTAVAKQKYRSRKAVIILNDTLVITRDMEVPDAKSKDLDKIVKLQSQEYLPHDISEYILRFKTLIPAADSPRKLNYLLTVCVKNELVMDFYTAVKKAGLKPVAMDASVNSLIKYFQSWYRQLDVKTPEDNTCAVIDIGASTTRLVIFNDGLPVYQQVFTHNNQKADIIIGDTLKVERNQAEVFKEKYGLGYLYEESENEMAMTVGKVINTQVNILLNDIYKYLQNYAAKNPSLTIKKIYLTGGVSKMKGLDRYIQAAFSIPTSVMKPGWGTSILGHSKYENNDVKGASDFPYYTSICGAVIRGD